MKRFIALLLCVIMIVPQAAFGSLAVDEVTIVSMEAYDASPLMEYYDGDWREDWDYENDVSVRWFDYEVARANPMVKFTYSDGSTKELRVDEIEGFSFSAYQWCGYQWKAGNTYTATLFYEDLECEYTIEIIPSDVASIEINELSTLTEGISGHYSFYYEDPENQSGGAYYYEYWSSTFVKSIKVNYLDGTSEILAYDDIRDRCYIDAVQDHSAPWTAGNSYPASIMYKGATCDFDVYITPNNIEKVEICKVKPFVEGKDCYQNSHYVDGEWKYYDYYWPYYAIENEEILITYTDGTTATEYMYHIDEYNYKFIHDQSYDNQWTAGNTYPVTLLCFGRECEFEITVTADPVESIEVYEYNDVIEGTNGWYASGWSEELQKNDSYYYYPLNNIIKSVKFNYTDGTSAVIPYKELKDVGMQYTQDYENRWLPGNTYTITLTYGKHTYDFDVTVQPNNIESIQAWTTLVLTEGEDNGWSEEYIDGEWVKYPYYDPINALKSIKINYTDGTSEIKNINDIGGYIVTCDQDYYNQWIAGNDYSATFKYAEEECTFWFSIAEDPVVSIEAIDIPVITEGTLGRYLNEYDEDYGGETYYYAYYTEYLLNTLRINYSDGTYEDYSFRDLFYAGESWLEYNQSIENQWIGGGTYPVTVHYGNHSCDFEVYIAPNNIASIAPYELGSFIEGNGCGPRDEYDEETDSWLAYNYYYVDNIFSNVLVTYEDGSTEIVDLHSEEYVILTDQSYHNQWTAGNTYSATLMMLGEVCEFNVYIEADPIESIEIYELAEVVEGFGGNMDKGYDHETGEYHKYYRYYVHELIKSIKINYSDGTSEIIDWNEFEDDGVSSNQSWDNPWTVGSKCEITVYKANHTATAEFELIPSPVENLEIIGNPVLVEKEDSTTNTWWTEEGPVEYESYRVWESLISLEFKIYYKDGAVETVEGGELNYSMDYTQDYYNQWLPGNSYPVTVMYGGVSVTVNVEVVENPIANIEIYETRPLEEHSYGWWCTEYDENGNELEWFKYSPSDAIISLKITYKDGTSEIVDRSYMNSWSTYDDQRYDNQWTAGNIYPATICFMGFEMNFSVSITEYIPFNYFIQDGGVFITDVKDHGYFINNNITDFVIPSEIAGYPVIGVTGIYGLTENVKTLTIPASVIHLSDYAFTSFNNVETVYIEGTETYICPETFYDMDSVKEFVLNEDHTMYTEIDGVIFDKDVTTIKAYPVAKGSTYELPITISDLSFQEFYWNVEFIVHPDSEMFVTENGITYNKDKTQIISCDKTVSGDYVMPDTVESIASGLFEECDNLTSIKISSKVTEIAYATFAGCDNLKSVILPERLEYIGGYAFSGCTALEGIQFPDSLNTIDYRAFLNSGLKSLTIPGSVTFIGYSSFEDTNIETLTIEESTTEEGLGIESSAFAYNTSLKTVSLGEGLGYLGSSAFEGCSSLTSINIPDSLHDSIGSYVFASCSSLTYLPIGKNQTWIPCGEFYNCSGLVDITIPEGIGYIDDSAFNSCANLKKVTIPDSVEMFGNYIFAYCTALDYVPLGANQQYISVGEFRGCTNIKEFIVPDRIESIFNRAFMDCDKLSNVKVHDKLTYIGHSAFAGCDSLKSFATGDALIEISEYTFANSGLESIEIGSSVQYIGGEAFLGSKLTSVTIPSNVTEIAYFAFYNCKDLDTITMPETLVSLGGHTFDGTKWYDKQPEGPVYLGTALYDYKGDIPAGSDKEIYLKEGILSIAGHAFENFCVHEEKVSWRDESFSQYLNDMSGLKAVHIPEGVVEIGEFAFVKCSGLTEIYLPASLEQIEEEAFTACGALTTVYYAGSEEQWAAIDKTEGNGVLDDCEIVYNYVDKAPEKVTVTINGEQAEYSVGETVKLEAKKLTYDPETGKAYVFLGWNVNGAEIVDNGDGTYDLTIGSADVSVSQNSFLHGSADGDDAVTASDITAVIKKMKSSDSFSMLCDVDFDGVITASDITNVIKIMKGQYNYED